MNVTLQSVFENLDSATDEKLQSYFTATGAIGRLSDFGSRRSLAVGLKGVGKTAAYRYLTEFDNTPDVVIGINIDRFSLSLPNRNLHYATCRKQFEHDITLEALRGVTEKRVSLKTRISKHYLDAAATEVRTYIETLKSVASRFGGLSLIGCGFTVRQADAVVAIGLGKQSEVNAPRVLKAVCEAGIKIRIVVDDPEQVFSASRELDTHLIGGFCLAALRMSQANPNLKVIPLLKTHVYYPTLVDVDDLRQYPDHMERLCWTRDELIDVVTNRLKLLGSSLPDLFRGTEKQGRQHIEAMCAEVRDGPRDLLWWIYLCLKHTKGDKISAEVLKQTKAKMSKRSLGELVSAHSGHYKRIGEVVKCIFRKEPIRKYSLNELRKHIADLMLKDKEMKSLWKLDWMQMQTHHALPALLFEVGAIAMQYKGTLILPYEEGYDTENFEEAESVELVPALLDAMS